MAIKVIWSHSQSSEARETTSYVLCGFFLFLVQKTNKTKQNKEPVKILFPTIKIFVRYY